MAENNFDYPEDILKECVRQKYSGIVGSFESTGYVLNSLFEAGTITKDEKQQIERLPERRSAALIDLLYTCQRPKAIAQFLEILSNNQMTACRWITDEVHEAAHNNVAPMSTSSLEVQRIQSQRRQHQTIIMEQYLSSVYKKCIQKLLPASTRKDTF